MEVAFAWAGGVGAGEVRSRGRAGFEGVSAACRARPAGRGGRAARRPTVLASTAAEPAPEGDGGRMRALGNLTTAVYKFSRPHTIRGTFLAAFAGCIRAIVETGPSAVRLALVPRALMGLAALVFGNLYIVGINQIYDVAIDKVNKPFLPLASDDMTISQAKATVAVSCVAGLAIVYANFSSLIFGLYTFGLVIGTLYSVPPFRLRRYPLAAALSISCARGFLLNFGVYHATKNALLVPFAWSAPITFLAIFMTVFATVIALSKDMPDIKGDKQHQVQTFAVKLGPRKLANIVIAILAANYVFAISFGAWACSKGLLRPVTIVAHAFLLLILLVRSRKLNPDSQDSIKQFYYKFIWNLFYAEYLLFPFI